MSITTATGHLDYNLGYILPNSGGTWADTTATTWDNFLSWNIGAVDPLIWVTEPIDFGSIDYFNVKILAKYIGDLRKYEIWTSSTGAFAGEETYYVVNEGDVGVLAFYGRYMRVAAWVYAAGDSTALIDLSITQTNQMVEVIKPDVNSQSLPYWPLVEPSTSTVAMARVLDIGRSVSAVVSVQIQPHYIAPPNYVSSGMVASGYLTVGYQITNDQNNYFELIDFGGICQSAIVRKLIRSNYLDSGYGTAFILQDQNGDFIDNTVDVRIKALPEQYMNNGQLLFR